MVKITRLKDRLYMSPLKKYEKYGKFPFKIVIQILLVLFTTCQVILVVNQDTTYAYNQYILFNYLFLNNDVQGSDTTITNSYNIYGINSLTKYIQTSVDRYYDINSHSIDNYNYYYNSDGLKVPAKLTIEYLDNAKALNDGYKIEYSLYSTDIGPFSDKHDVKSFLNNVKKFEVRFKLIHDLDRYVELASDCYE